ncbi:hypothetical protein [Marinitoga lauensis]|uniref:hypothetical protein n=1 Tax=Marinitoga lauensis TaxID=2201189 RepID=UPI00198148AA|nr:hypothetical protein [Marinitoga lauensis]
MRETTFGKEYLKIIDNKTFRVRVTESFFFQYERYLKILKTLESLNEFGIILPEKIEYDNENYYINFEYWNEVPITEVEISEEIYYNILYTVFDIVDRLTHSSNIIIPYIYLEDIFIDETNNITMIPSIFIPVNNEKIIINNKKNEDGVIDLLINFSVKLYDLMNKQYERIDNFINMLKNETFECVHDLYNLLTNSFDYKNKKEKIRVPHFINRAFERDKILKVIGKKHIYIYGNQRVGKTRLINFMEFKFKELGYTIIKAYNIKDLFPGDIIVPETLNVFYFLKLIDLMKTNQEDFKLIIIVDDYQEIDIKFKNFIEDIMSKNFEFPFSFILVSHIPPAIKFDNTEYIELKPFGMKETEILLKILLSSTFLKKYPEIVDIVYNISEGYPGNIFQIIKDLVMLKIIKIEDGKYEFYPENLKDKKIIDLAVEKIEGYLKI